MTENDRVEHELTSRTSDYAAHSSGRIQAQVSSFKDGLQVFDKVSIVRVRSRHANLLIMEDYMPIIGEIEGGVDFIGKEFIQSFDDIRGFFHHAHNVFFLLLKDTQGSSKKQARQEKRESAKRAETESELGSTADVFPKQHSMPIENLEEERTNV